VGVLAAWLPTASRAHAFLDHAQPAVGSAVATAPSEVTVWFTEPPTAVHDALRVFDAQNRRVDRDDTHASQEKALTVSLPKLTPGRYRVVWRVLATTDGHITNGNFTFAVGVADTTAKTCDLQVSNGWIRAPTPNATVLAGYATLRDGGSTPLTLIGVDSSLFQRVQMHDNAMSDGMMQMRPLPSLTLGAGASVQFAPEGRHFMLTGPARALHAGEHVRLRFSTDNGCAVESDFLVAAKAPAPGQEQRPAH
jgi:copper(I)-binding protein